MDSDYTCSYMPFFENYLGNPVANSLFFYVYTFHMPAFFLIAGLFSKKTVEDRRIDKVAPTY